MSVERFEQRKRDEGLKPNTVRSYAKCVRAYLAWLQQKKEEPSSDNATAFLLAPHLGNAFPNLRDCIRIHRLEIADLSPAHAIHDRSRCARLLRP